MTREVKLEVVVSDTDEDPWGNTQVGLEAVGVINRSDFDMKFNQALGPATSWSTTATMSRHISAVQQA